MSQLNPTKLFQRIAKDIPKTLHQNLIVTGSLAAAYEFQTRLAGQAVNTKDADLVVHPAGSVDSCAKMTEHLLEIGWTKIGDCYPQPKPDPLDDLHAIRLYPPQSTDYFIEFLNIPKIGQQNPKEWISLELADGWYGLPSFRFMGVVALETQTSSAGIDYANSSMMALTNLLSHPQVGTARIESGNFTGLLRGAKDLGRVIALAHLTGRDETEAWIAPWLNAFDKCFPTEKRSLGETLGDGLRELITDPNALNDAHKTTDIGLLNGMNVTPENLKATGERLIVDVIDPVQQNLKS